MSDSECCGAFPSFQTTGSPQTSPSPAPEQKADEPELPTLDGEGYEDDGSDGGVYGDAGTPSKYATPREFEEGDEPLDAEEAEDEDGSAFSSPENAASRQSAQSRISAEILESIFRAIGDAMRHHRTVFRHDLHTTHGAFSAFDRDDSGQVSLTEFQAAMRRLDVPLTDEQLHQIFETFDADGNGLIEYTEFAQELHRHGQAQDEDEDEDGQEEEGQEQEESDEEQEGQEEGVDGGGEQVEAGGDTGRITYQIDADSDEDEEYHNGADDAEQFEEEEEEEEVDENLTMPVIVEETMEEVADITPSPRDSPQAGGGGAAVDTEAELQLFVEEWRALDVSGVNKLSLKELAILLQRLPVPMGVGEAGGADELGELMTQLLVSRRALFDLCRFASHDGCFLSGVARSAGCGGQCRVSRGRCLDG